jgi:hypothetical protein
MNQEEEVLRKILNSGVVDLMLEQWQDKLIFIAAEKVLLAISNLTMSIKADLLKETLKTGVMRILI